MASSKNKAMFALMVRRQEAARNEVLNTSNRGQSAYVLAQMALDHSGGGSSAAAHLLIAMEYKKEFDFTKLLKLDATNRAHADLVLLGYKAHEIWPSTWMTEEGYDGVKIMSSLRDKWTS